MTVSQFHSYATEVLKPTAPMFLLVPHDTIAWKPTDDSFTVGQLMYHIAGALQFNATGIARNEWSMPTLRHIFVANRRTPTATVDEALALYRKTSSLFLNLFETMSDEEFQTAEVDSPQLGHAQKWKIAMFAMEHHLSHKAELFMYLKLMGVKVTTRELYGR
jgi:uncharacterized damage-inducible protein DinB